MFLKQVDLNLLSEYFNKSRWKKTKTLIDTKIEHCYCPICSQVCLQSSTECDKCKFWYHYECGHVNIFYRSGRGKTWICSKYGFTCVGI